MAQTITAMGQGRACLIYDFYNVIFDFYCFVVLVDNLLWKYQNPTSYKAWWLDPDKTQILQEQMN